MTCLIQNDLPNILVILFCFLLGHSVYASDESSLFQRTHGVLKRIEFPKDFYASSRYLKHRVYKFEITCTKVIPVSN